MQLIDCKTESVVLPQIEIASNLWHRFRGLMFRKNFVSGFGLWIEPCRSVHTMWMRINIDVYFIGKDGTIMEVHEAVKPWSIVIPKKRSFCVLEVPTPDVTLAVGSRVRLVMEGNHNE